MLDLRRHWMLLLNSLSLSDLFAYIDKHRRLSEPEVKFLAYQLCQALAVSDDHPPRPFFFLVVSSSPLPSQYLHSLGISHRDIKPENILLKLNMSSLPRVLLTDFGSAHCTDPTGQGVNKRCSSWVGTNAYMSPDLLTVVAAQQRADLQGREARQQAELGYDGFKVDCFALGGERQPWHAEIICSGL